MDLDDFDAPSQVPSRPQRFAPRSKPNQKPKSEPVSKPEPQDSIPKAEPQELDAALRNVKADEEAMAAKVEASSASNGDVKMDIETNTGAKNEAKEDDSADEDVVVREIDVFFNAPMDDDTKLYVLQYPLRPSWRPYELDDRCEEVRVKPMSAQVEVDLAIDVDSKNYDQDSDSRLRMTKQTLSSSWKVPHTIGHAIGVLTGNKLHLNTIHAAVQLRPSLEHLRPGGAKRKNNVTGDTEVIVKLEESAEGKSVGPSKKQNKRMEPSTEKRIDDEEPWIPLMYHGAKSEHSARYLQRMAAQKSSPIQFTMNPYDYIDSLCPVASDNSIKPKRPSRRSLLSLPLEERIKKLLCEGPPVQRFSYLKHFAPDCSDEECLEALQKYALLVQGLWAPKSPLLIPDDGQSSLARDYLLLLFSKSLVIREEDIPTNLRRTVKVFLDAFAVERSSSKFRFKEPADASFIKCYPGIVDAQNEVWNRIRENLDKYIRGDKSGPRERIAVSKPSIGSTPRKIVNSDRSLIKNASGKSNWRKTISEETREALLKALPKVFQTHKVCSFQLVCERLRTLAISQSTLPKADPRMAVAAAYGVDAPPEELQEIINQVAMNIHGLYVLKSSPEHPEYDPLRRVVIDLLRAKPHDAMLKKADVFQAAKMVLKRDITNNEYSKVMSDICVSKGSAWVLKNGDGSST